ncbi:MAG TPA: hypothetical protein VM733_03985 [Thermoanaerobaculia bacterium]|nr:hypothetical protein [Thermoanaerobaculia bacterium]
MRLTPVVALLLAACAGGERGATTASDAAAVVKETVNAVRAKEQVVVRIRVEDARLRDAVEDRLVLERIGTIVERGGGTGYVLLVLEVDSTAEAVPRVRAVLREMELLEKSSVEIRQAR